MAQIFIDQLIKDNFEIPFLEPVRVSEEEDSEAQKEEITEEKRAAVLAHKRQIMD